MEITRSSNLTPRAATSKQWSDLPAELIRDLMKIFTSQFKAEAARGEFMIEGRIYPEELVMRAGFLEKGRLAQINFEASMDLPKNSTGPLSEEDLDNEDSKTMSSLYTCIDALGSLMEEYFELSEDEEIDVPKRWQAFDFEGETVYLQHSTFNSKLEEEADRILGLLEKKLVHEESSSEDALANAEVNSELAFEVQKAIRSGKFPRQNDEPGSDSNA